jgi:demethoxyubiquinone hydroxylase (CLK1/Coq7/Cat5 family)
LTSFDVKPEQKTKELIDKIIRVDQAGELAADRIYAGQMAVLGRTDVGPTIQVYSLLIEQLKSILFHLISICGMKKKLI